MSVTHWLLHLIKVLDLEVCSTWFQTCWAKSLVGHSSSVFFITAMPICTSWSFGPVFELRLWGGALPLCKGLTSPMHTVILPRCDILSTLQNSGLYRKTWVIFVFSNCTNFQQRWNYKLAVITRCLLSHGLWGTFTTLKDWESLIKSTFLLIDVIWYTFL